MRRLIVAFSTLVLMVAVTAAQNQALAQTGPSPTLDILLFASNESQPPIETPDPSTLVVTSRSSSVVLNTMVDADGVNSTLETDPNGMPGATIRFTVSLLTLTEFTITGTVTFDDAQNSTIEFETVADGKFEDFPSVLNGVPFLRGGYIARVTGGTGQFANMEGVATVNLLLDISRPGLNNAIEFTYMLFRLAPLP